MLFLFLGNYFLSLQLSSPSTTSPSDQVTILVACDPLVVTNVPTYPPPPPTLYVYHCHQTPHHPLGDYILVPSVASPPTPTLESSIPIVFYKGICSIRNPSLHNIGLSYHRLSLSIYI